MVEEAEAQNIRLAMSFNAQASGESASPTGPPEAAYHQAELLGHVLGAFLDDPEYADSVREENARLPVMRLKAVIDRLDAVAP